MYVRYMDIKHLCYLILVRKDLSTSLCVRYSKSGSGTLFVPMSELFSPEGILIAQVNVTKVLGHVSMI